MGTQKDTCVLSKYLQKKFSERFGEESAEPQVLEQVADDLASKFSWNMSMAKKNQEILVRQIWMRIRSRNEK